MEDATHAEHQSLFTFMDAPHVLLKTEVKTNALNINH